MRALSLDRYISAVHHYRWLVVLLSFLVMVAFAAGARFITVSNDYRIMFSEDNPQFVAYKTLENTYTTANRALIAVAPRQGSVFNRKTLAAITELTEAAWHAPYSSRVDSLTNYSWSEADEDILTVRPLVEDAQYLSDADLEQIETAALNSIEIAGRLVARDGRVAGVAISFVLPDGSDQAVTEINDYIQDQLAKAREKWTDIDYYVTGEVVLSNALAVATKDDLKFLAPIMFVIIVLATALLLRSVSGTVAVVVMLLFVVNSTMGLAGWAGTVLSGTNSGIPLIVTVIAVASSIHIITSALRLIRQGLAKQMAIAEAMRSNIRPVLLTCVTTAIGFLSLNFSDSPPFHVLGNYVAFGVLCVFLYSVTLLPALLSILPLRATPGRVERYDFFGWLGAFVIARRKILLWSITLLTIFLSVGIYRMELGDNWTRYFDDRYDFRLDTDYINQHLTGTDSLEYTLSAGREGGITDLAYLRAVDAFAEWFRNQPEVVHVQAFPDIMKRLNKNMHGDDPAFYSLPNAPELAAQYLLLYELSLPFGLDLNDRIDIAKSATRMSVAISNLSSLKQRELDERAQAWLQSNVPQIASEATGFTMIFAHISIRNTQSMLLGTAVAMGLISLILIGVFRSVPLGLVSLVPNLIPAIMSLGLWGYLVGRVGLAGSVMAVIAFGIVVDDTIHFLTRYLKARNEGLSAPESVQSALNTVGYALCTTTVILVLGFMVFAFSGFEVSWALGLLVMITLVFALVTDFLLLPALLMAIDRKELKK